MRNWTKMGNKMWVNDNRNETVEILEENDYYNITKLSGGVRRSIGSAETMKKAEEKAVEYMESHEEPDSILETTFGR